MSIQYSGNAIYTLADNVVPGFAKSLQITQYGFEQNLTLDLGSVPGDIAAFFANSTLSLQFSAPPSTSTFGWDQIYSFGFVEIGTSWQNLAWTGGTGYYWTFQDVIGSNDNSSQCGPTYFYEPATELRSQIVTLNYAGLIPILEADGFGPSSGDVEIVFSTNTAGGSPPNYLYMNNVVLSVPEPATGALILAGGAMALLRACRRIKTNA